MRRTCTLFCLLALVVVAVGADAAKLSKSERRAMLGEFEAAGLTRKDCVAAYEAGLLKPHEYALYKAKRSRKWKWGCMGAAVVLGGVSSGFVVSAQNATAEAEGRWGSGKEQLERKAKANMTVALVFSGVGVTSQLVSIIMDARQEKWHLRATEALSAKPVAFARSRNGLRVSYRF